MLTDGLTGTAATTTAAGLDAVFLQVGEVGVTGSRVEVHRASTVVLWPLVFVANHHADGGTQGDAELGAGLDLHAVLLIPGGRQGALTGTSSSHLGLNVVLGELHARGAAIDNAADGAAVGFTIAGGSRVSVSGSGVVKESHTW